MFRSWFQNASILLTSRKYRFHFLLFLKFLPPGDHSINSLSFYPLFTFDIYLICFQHGIIFVLKINSPRIIEWAWAHQIKFSCVLNDIDMTSPNCLTPSLIIFRYISFSSKISAKVNRLNSRKKIAFAIHLFIVWHAEIQHKSKLTTRNRKKLFKKKTNRQKLQNEDPTRRVKIEIAQNIAFGAETRCSDTSYDGLSGIDPIGMIREHDGRWWRVAWWSSPDRQSRQWQWARWSSLGWRSHGTISSSNPGKWWRWPGSSWPHRRIREWVCQ